MELCAAVYTDASLEADALRCSAHFKVPCLDGCALDAAKPKHVEQLVQQQLGAVNQSCVLLIDRAGWQLIAFGAAYRVSIRADFYGATTTYRRLKGGGKGQMIAKAVGVHSQAKLKVLDATAGLGGDAFVLASLGCSVTMVERHPVVRWLLADGLAQASRFAAKEDPSLQLVLERMVLVECDSIEYFEQLIEADLPDVVYVDPMFPTRTKRALVKKEMRVFHALVGEDADAEKLLPLALNKARYRTVVKRPRLASCLANQAPSHELVGKANRYDVYINKKIG